MITKEEALTATHVHGIWRNRYGKCQTWRRNGRTQTWKTRPEEFRLPIKWGMYAYGAVTHLNANEFHTADNCPYKEESNGS